MKRLVSFMGMFALAAVACVGFSGSISALDAPHLRPATPIAFDVQAPAVILAGLVTSPEVINVPHREVAELRTTATHLLHLGLKPALSPSAQKIFGCSRASEGVQYAVPYGARRS